MSDAQDWCFMAMAHHRLGEYDEAVRWLGHFRDYRPTQARQNFWVEQEIRLLRREAERLVLDPAFPADPFAPKQ
jgi:hypothetical protein